jgi:3-hydroxyethyl bacteriochlorophyllide a dehydrogenase
MNSLLSTRAVIITGPGSADVRNFTSRPLNEGEVRVANTVTAVSIGTEYLVVSGLLRGCTYPCLLGYQGVGRISEIGPGVKNYSIGDRVCSGLSSWQPENYGQGSGNGHQSQPIVSHTGDFAQSELVQIPDEVTDEEASYAWLGAVAMQGIERAMIAPKEVVAVVGLGIVGQFAAQICKAMGAIVYVCDLQPGRVALAREAGADIAIAGGVDALNKKLREDFPNGASVIIECTGNSRVLDAALELAAFAGRVVLQGHYPGELSFHFIPAHQARLTLLFPCAWGDLRPILELMRQKKLSVTPWISDTFSPDEVGELYARIHSRDSTLNGAIIRWTN